MNNWRPKMARFHRETKNKRQFEGVWQTDRWTDRQTDRQTESIAENSRLLASRGDQQESRETLQRGRCSACWFSQIWGRGVPYGGRHWWCQTGRGWVARPSIQSRRYLLRFCRSFEVKLWFPQFGGMGAPVRVSIRGVRWSVSDFLQIALQSLIGVWK